MNMIATKLIETAQRFKKEEEGLALTEYLILLGLLTSAVIIAITAFGGSLATLWQGWATWLATLTGAPT